MAGNTKAKKIKPAVRIRPTASSPFSRVTRRILLNSIMVVATLGILALGFQQLRTYVDKRLVFPAQPPRVLLKNRPTWMSPALADRIIAAARPNGAHSAFDQQMLKDIVDTLSKDANIAPWISKVRQVRRVYSDGPADAIEIDCDFRAPMGLVHWGDYYWFVDADGVKLPEQFKGSQLKEIVFDAQGLTNVHIIDGVRKPPPESGKKWLGEDLNSGLELVKYLYAKPYAQEIVTVNVENFDGRQDRGAPQLVLVTRYGTRILWGRPIGAKDYFVEIPPQRKLAALQSVVQKYGRVDAKHSWIDVRFEQLLFPIEEVPATEPTQANTGN